ncbi:MAG TPA: hypothetical protein VKE88_03565 [Candidatus Nanoarchaeia archaeon]|nr:hypothetical protein [Candidatus Nanoarchaeia archaeon]
MRQKRLIIGILLLLNIAIAFAAPEITSFNIKKVYPANIQFSWEISDDDGLASLEIYQDGKKIYHEALTGTKQVSLYQIMDDKKAHTFDLYVYNILNESARSTKVRSSDITAPIITAPLKISANKKSFSFVTNEPATCSNGFSDKTLTKISDEVSLNHTTTVTFREGVNRVLLTCTDQQDNVMEGFFVVEYTYDGTAPTKVTNVQSAGTKISWTAATDSSGIDHYNIYSSLTNIASTIQTYWDVSTNDSFYYIAAVDKAGNEGDKVEFNYGRGALLGDSFIAEAATEEKEAEAPVDPSLIPEKEAPVQVPVIAWSVFGVLVVLFIIWKVYEHKTDPHGLRKYIKQRRKMRA